MTLSMKILRELNINETEKHQNVNSEFKMIVQ